MKKTCSIFVTALILYLSVINMNPAFAAVLGEACSETKSISVNQKIDKNYSNTNIKDTSQSNKKDNDVLEVFNHATQQVYITAEDIDLMAKLVSAESIGEP